MRNSRNRSTPIVSDRPGCRAAALALAVAAGLTGSEASAGVDTTAPCTSSSTRLCVGEGRFEVGVEWQTPAPRSGNGRLASLAGGGGSVPRVTSSDSALFWFFEPNNWEMLVKVLDACAVNDHFWVFAAATTNVGYTLEVTDTWSGEVFRATHPVDVASPALTRARALGTCSAPPPAGGSSCVPSAETACLQNGRFEVTIDWRDGAGSDGRARVAALPEPNPEPPAALPVASSDSGVFWFFREDNWEMLVKVLDGCAANDRFWVFAAAMTNAVRKGPWLIVGDEYGRVYLVDLRLSRPHGVAGVGLRHATGHTELGAIEIRALWVDEHDDLIFAGSSWGNDTTRGPELPSFFVLELVEDP